LPALDVNASSAFPPIPLSPYLELNARVRIGAESVSAAIAIVRSRLPGTLRLCLVFGPGESGRRDDDGKNRRDV
jgi:hypothetical protein